MRVSFLGLALAFLACSKAHAPPLSRTDAIRPGSRPSATAAPAVAPLTHDDASPAEPRAAPHGDAKPDGATKRPEPAVRLVRFAEERSAYVVTPSAHEPPTRLLAMIHGVCTPPSYVCGEWKSAASEFGLLVCPIGNATCGPDGTGAPTWEGAFAGIDTDLERSITAVTRVVPERVSREGAVLAGFSRGAYVAVILAVRHPRRWPYLILNEADVDLTLPMLRDAGVRAVALIAGEWGTQIVGERRTEEALVRQGYPARLWVMPKVGHAYSGNIDAIMREALEFVLRYEPASRAPTP